MLEPSLVIRAGLTHLKINTHHGSSDMAGRALKKKAEAKAPRKPVKSRSSEVTVPRTQDLTPGKFAFTAELDALFARGWPEMRVLDSAPVSDDAAHDEAPAVALGIGAGTRGLQVSSTRGLAHHRSSVSWLLVGRGTSALRHLVCSLWAASWKRALGSAAGAAAVAG